MTNPSLQSVKDTNKKNRKSKILKSNEYNNRVLVALNQWMLDFNFDPEIELAPEVSYGTVQFSQKLLDYDLNFYMSSDRSAPLFAMMIYVDENAIPREKQAIIRDWITWRNTSLDIGAFQLTPDSKHMYYCASIDFRNISEIDTNFITNIYKQGRVSVITYLGEFFNLIKI